MNNTDGAGEILRFGTMQLEVSPPIEGINPDFVREHTGHLVVAQLVGVDGRPQQKLKLDACNLDNVKVTHDEYYAQLNAHQAERHTRVDTPPFVGMVRLLRGNEGSNNAGYFGVDCLGTASTAIIPYSPTKFCYVTRLAMVVPET